MDLFDIAVLIVTFVLSTTSSQHLSKPYVFGQSHYTPQVSHAFTRHQGSSSPTPKAAAAAEHTSNKPKRFVLVPKSPHYGSEPMILNHMEVADLPKGDYDIVAFYDEPTQHGEEGYQTRNYHHQTQHPSHEQQEEHHQRHHPGVEPVQPTSYQRSTIYPATGGHWANTSPSPDYHSRHHSIGHHHPTTLEGQDHSGPPSEDGVYLHELPVPPSTRYTEVNRNYDAHQSYHHNGYSEESDRPSRAISSGYRPSEDYLTKHPSPHRNNPFEGPSYRPEPEPTSTLPHKPTYEPELPTSTQYNHPPPYEPSRVPYQPLTEHEPVKELPYRPTYSPTKAPTHLYKPVPSFTTAKPPPPYQTEPEYYTPDPLYAQHQDSGYSPTKAPRLSKPAYSPPSAAYNPSYSPTSTPYKPEYSPTRAAYKPEASYSPTRGPTEAYDRTTRRPPPALTFTPVPTVYPIYDHTSVAAVTPTPSSPKYLRPRKPNSYLHPIEATTEYTPLPTTSTRGHHKGRLNPIYSPYPTSTPPTVVHHFGSTTDYSDYDDYPNADFQNELDEYEVVSEYTFQNYFLLQNCVM